MVRKTKLAVVVAAGALVLAGCGSSSKSNATTGTTAAGGSGAKPGAGKKLVLIQGIKSDEFYITMGCGAKAEAAKLGASIDVTGPSDFSAPLQIPIVNSVTAQKPDAVLIAPTDTQALIGPMKQMKDAGIKIVQVDTTVTDASLAVSSISSDNKAGGVDAAKTLSQLIGDKGSVIVINVKPGISTTDARAQGFNQEMQQNHPNIKVLDVQYDQDDPTKAAGIVTATLAAHPDLAGIFATNVLTAEGVATGLKNAGAKDKVKVVGFDAGPKQVADLQNGTVQALIAQQPGEIGAQGVDQAINALTAKAVQQNIATQLVSITTANLASSQAALYKASC
jgi:ribose transport system substrate-binding protein